MAEHATPSFRMPWQIDGNSRMGKLDGGLASTVPTGHDRNNLGPSAPALERFRTRWIHLVEEKSLQI
jgi:hypothetical protein